jgi:hypothetical protein
MFAVIFPGYGTELHVGFLRGLFTELEDAGDIFLRSIICKTFNGPYNVVTKNTNTLI